MNKSIKIILILLAGVAVGLLVDKASYFLNASVIQSFEVISIDK